MSRLQVSSVCSQSDSSSASVMLHSYLSEESDRRKLDDSSWAWARPRIKESADTAFIFVYGAVVTAWCLDCCSLIKPTKNST